MLAIPLGEALLSCLGALRTTARALGACYPAILGASIVLGGVYHTGAVAADSGPHIQTCGSFGIERWTTQAYWYFFQCYASERAWCTPLVFQDPEQETVPKLLCKRMCLPPQQMEAKMAATS